MKLNNDIFRRWCDFVIEYKLSEIKFENQHVEKLIYESSQYNYKGIVIVANRIYENLNK